MDSALQALREYGASIRGDWGDLDGRSVQNELDAFADHFSGGPRTADWTVEQWREDLGLCPSGGGHWTRHCQPVKKYGDGPEDFYGCGNEPSRW